jgi:hypothetical protein
MPLAAILTVGGDFRCWRQLERQPISPSNFSAFRLTGELDDSLWNVIPKLNMAYVLSRLYSAENGFVSFSGFLKKFTAVILSYLLIVLVLEATFSFVL